MLRPGWLARRHILATGSRPGARSTPPGASLHVGYLTTHYPALSHVFIEREVRAVRSSGTRVSTFSIRPSGAPDVLGAAHAAAYRETTCLFSISKSRWVSAHLRFAARHPRTYLSTLRDALGVGHSVRDKVWQLIYLAEAVMLFTSARAQGVQHLHAHHANNVAEVSRLACQLSRVLDEPWEWSFTMHGSAEFWNVERFRLVHKVQHAQFVACISDFTRSQLMALTPEAEWHKMHVVHMGVDMERYPAHATLRQARRTNQADRTLRVLFVGRLIEAKGVSLLIQALADMRLAGHHVHAHIVGDGPFRNQLERLVTVRGLDAFVDFVGPLGQEDLLREYEWADAFCLPSFIEGLPVVLMEAIASELPVVTTRIAGISELVIDGTAGGVLVRPGRTDDLAAALSRMLEDGEWADDLGRKGRALVQTAFDSHTEGAKLARLFDSYAGLAADC